MHNTRSFWFPDVGDFRIDRKHGLHERSGGIACTRMHNKPGRLIDHNHVVIDIHDWHIDIGFGNQWLWTEVRLNIDLDGVAIGYSTRTSGNNGVVTNNEALFKPFSDTSSARTGNHCNDSVDAFSG